LCSLKADFCGAALLEQRSNLFTFEILVQQMEKNWQAESCEVAYNWRRPGSELGEQIFSIKTKRGRMDRLPS